MRIVWAAAIWIVFAGGLMGYMAQRTAIAPPPETSVSTAAATGVFTLVITPTFAAKPDPFALTAAGDSAFALQVRIGSRILLSRTEDIEPGRPIRVTIGEGLVAGINEIFIEASPPLDTADRSQAVRIQVLQDEITIAEDTFWADPGQKISETLRFETADQKEDPDHDH